MMTGTSDAGNHDDGVDMNTVDTGWVIDEAPAAIAARKLADYRFHPPLDIGAGAAWNVDPHHQRLQHRKHIWEKLL